MNIVLSHLIETLYALWWPFCRVMAMLSAAPVIGESMVPVPVRLLLSLVLAVVLLPVSGHGGSVDVFSLAGVVETIAQSLLGFVLGLAFHFTIAVITVFGYLLSSQIGFAMAVMNDPVNGTPSDVVSSLVSMMCIIVFFAIDGHLVLTGVVGASFRVWPVGRVLDPVSLQTVALDVAWVFSAALLLAMPMVFATLVVQIGLGFLTKVAPSLNLHSLGFPVVTLLGLVMLSQVVRLVPDHYVRMSTQVLDMVEQQMQRVAHG